MDDSTGQTIPLAPEELEEKIQCRVLDCDTISQVKHKILDALYRNTPFSLRPSIHEVDLGEYIRPVRAPRRRPLY